MRVDLSHKGRGEAVPNLPISYEETLITFTNLDQSMYWPLSTHIAKAIRKYSDLSALQRLQ